MIGYPGSESDRRVDADRLQAVVSAAFQRSGMASADAATLAESLVHADLRGVHSHGVLRVAEYVKKLRGGGVNPIGRPRVVKDRGAALVIDGDNSMGQIGGSFAMNQAVERARTTGVAVAAVGGSNHCGAMDDYALKACRADMIGIATTGALPTMAPWGGKDKILGINPLAVAIPAAEEMPIVLDIAFSGSSHGKIRVYHQKGLSIPEGWATDADGNPTTDSAAALEGLLQPIGGYKGTGLALVTGMLSTLLSGAAFGTELGSLAEGAKPGCDGHFFMALNVAAFLDVAKFKARVDGIIRQFRASTPVSPDQRVYLPGEREAEAQRRYRAEGIPLNAETLAGIIAVAEELGVDVKGLG